MIKQYTYIRLGPHNHKIRVYENGKLIMSRVTPDKFAAERLANHLEEDGYIYSSIDYWVNCNECIFYEDCEAKEDRDGCILGEKE